MGVSDASTTFIRRVGGAWCCRVIRRVFGAHPGGLLKPGDVSLERFAPVRGQPEPGPRPAADRSTERVAGHGPAPPRGHPFGVRRSEEHPRDCWPRARDHLALRRAPCGHSRTGPERHRPFEIEHVLASWTQPHRPQEGDLGSDALLARHDPVDRTPDPPSWTLILTPRPCDNPGGRDQRHRRQHRAGTRGHPHPRPGRLESNSTLAPTRGDGRVAGPNRQGKPCPNYHRHNPVSGRPLTARPGKHARGPCPSRGGMTQVMVRSRRGDACGPARQ